MIHIYDNLIVIYYYSRIRWNNFVKSWRPKGLFQFETIINVLVRSFGFICIPMLWVYDHYKYVYVYSAEINFSRQNNLTSTDVRF